MNDFSRQNAFQIFFVVSVFCDYHYHLGAALGNVLVLLLLRVRETVVFAEQGLEVAAVGLLAGREDQADAAPGNIPEAHVEAAELVAHHEEHSMLTE